MTYAKFEELARVKVSDPEQPALYGYVVARLWKDGRWLYKVSVSDPSGHDETFDNWYSENMLESYF